MNEPTEEKVTIAITPDGTQHQLDSTEAKLARLQGRVDAHCDALIVQCEAIKSLQAQVANAHIAIALLALALYLVTRELYAVPEVEQVKAT
jgi:hypothetical protein